MNYQWVITRVLKDITKQINMLIAKFMKKALEPYTGFQVDVLDGRAHFAPGHDCRITLHTDLADKLGFTGTEFHRFIEKAPMDAQLYLDNIFLYSDIIQPQITGNVRSHLLCVIPTRERNLIPAYFTPQHLQYIPLEHNNFSTIPMDIRDIKGKLVPFASGQSVVKLHFRRQNKP